MVKRPLKEQFPVVQSLTEVCSTWEENTNFGKLFGTVILVLVSLIGSAVLCVGYLNKRGQKQIIEKQLDKAEIIQAQLRKRNTLYEMGLWS